MVDLFVRNEKREKASEKCGKKWYFRNRTRSRKQLYCRPSGEIIKRNVSRQHFKYIFIRFRGRDRKLAYLLTFVCREEQFSFASTVKSELVYSGMWNGEFLPFSCSCRMGLGH